jgi:hypothetical protein
MANGLPSTTDPEDLMKTRGLLLAGAALLAVAFLAGFTSGRTADEGPAIKSHHLFNLPDGVTEEELASALTEINRAIFESGHHHAGYRLWKVAGEQAGDYAYMWEGSWPSQEAYEVIHDLETYQAAGESMRDIYEAISAVQIYNRYVEITAGFGCPHCEHMGGQGCACEDCTCEGCKHMHHHGSR